MAKSPNRIPRSIDEFIDDGSVSTTSSRDIRRCKDCGVGIDHLRFNKRYCEKCAFEKLSFEDKAKANPEFMLDKVEKVDYVICPICGHRSRVLNNHLL